MPAAVWPISRRSGIRSGFGVRARPMSHATSSTGAKITPNDLNMAMPSAAPASPHSHRERRPAGRVRSSAASRHAAPAAMTSASLFTTAVC